jgi:glucose/arabinose dehydrogenase
MRTSTFAAGALALSLLALTAASHPAASALNTERVASGLNRPLFVTAPPGDDRLFIVEQRGVIKILRNGQVLTRPFLDIDALVPNISGNDERGLLGLAFHPNFAQNRYIYLNYINLSNNTVIARYTVAASDADSVDVTSAFQIISITQPATNHNGGTLLFGPNDGYLYIGMGDGGNQGDPSNNGQRDDTLLAKMLRIDVDGGTPYAIPPTNPFAGPGLPLDEIWAKGFRNPYRWSFDRATGDMYIGDVGQVSWEEVDFLPALPDTGGQNCGWRLMEGNHCYNPPSNCDPGGLTYPVHEYFHSGQCSITGGYVYRGLIPEIQGHYFFADFCSNQIWSFKMVGGIVTEFAERTADLAPGGGLAIGTIAGFGEDGTGELYIVDRGSGTNGEIYKIVMDTTGVGGEAPPARTFAMTPATPNPFTGETWFAVEAEQSGELTAEIYDASGRLVRALVMAEPTAAGTRRLTWDGVNAQGAASPSGTYFLRVEMNGLALTQRLSLIR